MPSCPHLTRKTQEESRFELIAILERMATSGTVDNQRVEALLIITYIKIRKKNLNHPRQIN